ncbi:hypothetical protein DEJ12_14880 [Curtobacterium sp. MCLR17_059]|nr:hypothetical protein DEJ12_14880 [Curtobacterium sp. MCLR17_059]PZF51375.1 hypothetical protein DEJ10_09280 [Curtobacterium sp. MCLR17_057]
MTTRHSGCARAVSTSHRTTRARSARSNGTLGCAAKTTASRPVEPAPWLAPAPPVAPAPPFAPAPRANGSVASAKCGSTPPSRAISSYARTSR